ncbi:MAG TPA: hypothetical protein VMN36_15070 [Verrucomicrobiales bacterium]|nr:hypothetical protein [Verrucomicrobiales bacterium]
MPWDTLERLRRRIEDSPNLEEENRARILELIRELEAEIEEVAEEEHQERIRSAFDLADAAAHEGAQPERNDDLFHKTLESLEEAVRELEITHPKTAKVLYAVSRAFY